MTQPSKQFEGFQKWYRAKDDVIEAVEARGVYVINSGSCHMRELRELCEERGWSLEHEVAEVWIVRGE